VGVELDLNPIKRKRLSESAIDEIKNFISSNNLKEGSQLPSERELVSRLQISRGSLREALRILEIMGLVEVRPGKGIFVRQVSGDLVVPLPSWVNKYKDAIYKHFETRLILEPEVAALAARRITEDEIRAIQDNVTRQSRLQEHDVVGIIRTDIEFHLLVTGAAKNETITMLMNSLAKISFEGWKAALRVEGRNESAVREHTELVKILSRRDEDGARTAMREHMLASIQMLKTQGLNAE
jgi:DNA-binding FadR family transcriptional regulator